ncbi:MAG: dihydrolipoyl dehydrogenase [Candidatus Omnitrophica bacterium]|nr:dihydrolipoyl dehydrogenase [Candidatus Omnitrophota bacterium]
MNYDLAIIGAGWAGFNAAIRAKGLGLKVALIEKDQLGGTCLNRGCIPTKALIQSAKVYTLTKKSEIFGIKVTNPQIDFSKIQERKDKIIQQLSHGLQFMLRGIDLFKDEAKLLSPGELKVGSQTLKTKFILIAVGSRPMELKGLVFDGKKIVSSDEILNLKEVPGSLLIIGGGVIGCEFANLFSSLGTQVLIAEKMPQLLPGQDQELAKKLENAFKKKGIKVSTNTDAQTLELRDFDLALLCVGRTPDTKGLSLEKIGLNLEKERIMVDEYLKTNIANIYAAGDCTGQIMLAHFASYQGRIAAENIASPNNPKKINTASVPSCIFSDPELASVGMDEEGAKNKGIDIKVNRFDFKGSGMAHILDEAEGFIKIVSDKKTEQILGASIIGPRATELIGILTLAVSSRLKISQIQDTIFAHPTLTESIAETLKEGYGV